MYPNQGQYPGQNSAPYGAPNMPLPLNQQGFAPQLQYPYPPQQNQFPNQAVGGFNPQFPPQGSYPQQFPAQNAYPQQFPPQAYPQQVPNQAYPNQMGGNFTGQAPPQQFPNQVPQVAQQMAQVIQQVPQTSSTKPAVKKGRPSLLPASNFDASNDSVILRKAMKGLGTDEAALINVLCRRSHDQRMQILKSYKTAYGRDLYADVKSETSRNFELVLLALLTPIYEFYAKELHEAMRGAGTDEDDLIEILCTKSNAEILKIVETYEKLYKKKLESNLRGETSGSFKKLLTSMMAAGRDESMQTDPTSARADALALKKAGVDKFGTDESEFNRILCSRNHAQLKLVCEEYQRLTGSTLEKDIAKEFSGDIKNALLAIVSVVNNPHLFYATRLHKSMAGLGTSDRDLIRLVVTRSEIDMEDIKVEFQRKYSKTLKSFIQGDTSGDYRKALFALCGEALE